MNRKHLSAALMLSAFLMLGAPKAYSEVQQNQQVPDVSVVNLQAVQNADGSQSVITPKGDLAVLPGAGVNGNVAQIYFGSHGGFWYVDKTGNTVDLKATVESLQARRTKAAQQSAQVPEYVPMPQQDYYEDDSVQQDQGGSGGGRVSNIANTAVTAAAAGVGAAAGAALSNPYYRAPYGTPMYYGAGGPYYYNHGDRRELEDVNLNQNQKMAMYNKRQIDQQNKQKVASQAASQRSAASASAASAGTSGDFRHQQDWYNQQRQQNPSQFSQQAAASNPFARSGEGGERERRNGDGERERRGGDGDRERRGGDGDRERRGGDGDRERRGGDGDRERRGGGERRESRRGGGDGGFSRGGGGRAARGGGGRAARGGGGRRR
jgi:hypothetical protein